MKEWKRLEMLLNDPFWSHDDEGSFGQDGPGGIHVKTVEVADGYQWKVTWSDLSEASSPRSWHSRRETKDDLRRVVKERLMFLLEREGQPS